MKDDRVFIRHILDEVAFIIKEGKGLNYEDLVSNETLKRAVIRSLEIIGEATKNLSEDFRKKHPDIEWRELAGLRDKLIHHYFGINWKRVWDVIKNLIPEIEDKLRKISEE
ncbi:unnamed protein product [marine sediment metagenome]|uniref:DUF86 domain-containing protein n=1 Tax=marine sediment metagenome TaxID=412755 RepID=X1QYM2_9ZZZZ